MYPNHATRQVNTYWASCPPQQGRPRSETRTSSSNEIMVGVSGETAGRVFVLRLYICCWCCLCLAVRTVLRVGMGAWSIGHMTKEATRMSIPCPAYYIICSRKSIYGVIANDSRPWRGQIRHLCRPVLLLMAVQRDGFLEGSVPCSRPIRSLWHMAARQRPVLFYCI